MYCFRSKINVRNLYTANYFPDYSYFNTTFRGKEEEPNYVFFQTERNEGVGGGKGSLDDWTTAAAGGGGGGGGGRAVKSFGRRHRQRGSAGGKGGASHKGGSGGTGLLQGGVDGQQQQQQGKHVYESSDSETEATHAQVNNRYVYVFYTVSAHAFNTV